jgi:hypothetical protein
VQTPCTEDQWLAIAHQFSTRWNFDHCIGALDGKHIVIRPPPNTGSEFYNYKHTFSVVLLALVDADYRFIYVDIGTNGRISDGGVYEKSALSTVLDTNSVCLPSDRPLPGRHKSMPYVIVADEAFPLKNYIMKPYSGRTTDSVKRRIYNYRLSRARRVVENAFGILANRFRVFLAPIPLAPKKVQTIVLTACLLHNFLRGKVIQNSLTEASVAETDTITVQSSGQSWLSLATCQQRRYTDQANEIRNEFCEYFSSEGSVAWQEAMLREY